MTHNILMPNFNAKKQRRAERRTKEFATMSMREKGAVEKANIIADMDYYAYIATPAKTPWHWRIAVVLYRLVKRLSRLSLRKSFNRAVTRVKRAIQWQRRK